MKPAQIIEDILLSWVVKHQDQFSLSHAVDSIHALQLLKPLGELVLTCDVLIRSKRREAEAKTLLEWAWVQMDSGRTIHNLLLSRPDLLILTSVYASFHRNGFQSSHTFELLKYLTKTRFAAAVQFPNWRRLDFEHALEVLGLGKIRSKSISEMWSVRQPEPWLIEHDSAYAMTHEIFYVSDFGRASSRLPSVVNRYVELWLPSWIEIFTRQLNWDITAELLMVASCMPEHQPFSETFAGLSSIVEKLGFLPGPDDGGKNLFTPSDSDSRKAFLSNYHTVLVGLMAANLSLWRYSTSDCNLTRRSSGRAASGALLR